MLVFFTFMPPGAAIGGLGGALLFAALGSATPRSRSNASRPVVTTRKRADLGRICAMQNCSLRSGQIGLFEASNIRVSASRHGVANDVHQGRLLIRQIQFRNQTP